mmetsp:Transcript_30472/g.47709  ORF Transcript_30472/g.47709 Transcript_30472/m.47709 type:complete len:106 (-) Transcript_30472:1023-1340(-)
MGNPRRDAVEYGVLITITTSMAASYAFLLAYSSQTGADGKRQKLPKVNLDESVDLGQAWEDMKVTMRGLNRWRSSGFSSSPPSSSGGGGKTPVESNATSEDQPKR